ncbi:diguanylate cyclase, partial [Kineococcus sp. T13]|uniref:diguanylate cyclase n=1 Tax=Kineococcus vitellinus TaxID=2696565 RepID=UPI0014129244|nr:diguanylate cyclase [Kineococcus vitellinus]
MTGRATAGWTGPRGLRAGLAPFAPEVEADYRRARSTARARWFVPTALLGLLLFDAYALVDAVLAPEVLGLSLLLRLGVVTPAVLLGLLLRGARLRAHPGSGVDGPLVAGAALLLVAVLTLVQHRAPEALGGAYFGGAFVVVVFFTTLVRSDARQAALALVSLLAGFAWAQSALAVDPVPTELAGLLAVAVAGLFGLVMAVHVETSERAGFLARRRADALAREREELIEALAAAAERDELTGVLNRRGLASRVPAGEAPLSVLLVDVDRFKGYNDRRGHAAGDECLRRVVGALAAQLRPQDVLARVGGEEFAVLLEEAPALDGSLPGAAAGGAAAVAERLRAAVEDLRVPHPARPGSPQDAEVVTVSIGVATGVGFEAVLGAADAAMYAAKAGGRNTVRT